MALQTAVYIGCIRTGRCSDHNALYVAQRLAGVSYVVLVGAVMSPGRERWGSGGTRRGNSGCSEP